MMIPVTIPMLLRPSPHHTSTLNHSTSPQNCPSPSENHLTQNSFTPQQTHQNLFPMGNVTFFLQKMNENQEKHQQDVVQLLHSFIPTLSNHQIPHSSVQERATTIAAFSAKNAEKLHSCSHVPVQCTPAVKTATQPSP
ncbi:hypothetical protein LguiA_002455 [Lonicera macranthoides]